jgi:uncharacterized protein (TIGR03083 family)
MNRAEQAEFVALARSLSSDEWAAPSLCAGLSVRDVVVHIAGHIHDEPNGDEIRRAFLRSPFMPARIGRRLDVAQRSRNEWRSCENLVEWLLEPPDDPTSPTQLSEMVIHQQDIRRAIDRPRSISTDRIIAALDHSTAKSGNMSVNFARTRARGLRLVATDLDWTIGDGPEVTGPGEAILMAVNGRDQPLRDLSGAGLPTLSRRTAKWSAKFAAS